MKTCTHCLQQKDESQFYTYTKQDKHKTGALHACCKQCQKEKRTAHRKANPSMAYAAARRAKIKRLFGITPEDYDQMFSDQLGVCAICLRASPDGRRLHIDHDHATKVVRGLLCHDCNRGLGIFKDDLNRLSRAIEYLSRSKRKSLFLNKSDNGC
jgi:hypothetical protein